MTEKVIFEFRAELGEDGYRYKIRSGDGDFKLVKPPKRRLYPHMIGPCAPWTKGSKRSRRLKEKSRRHMRETLDMYESLYDDIYRDTEVSQD